MENESLPSPRKKVQKGESLWMMSFSDMSLVLLCFFVLLLSTMKPDKEKFNHVKEGMVAEKNLKKTDSMKSTAVALKKIIKKKKLDKLAQVSYDAEGMQIEFKNRLVFSSGSANLNKNFDKAAKQILKLITKMGKRYTVQVEGHTDDSPLKGSKKYPSNWELSAARGFSMMRKLHKMGVKEENLSVIAFAHTRPKVPYKNKKGKALRRARSVNRRVVVRIQ